MHTHHNDPAFADTEMANSVLPFPLVGLQRAPAAHREPAEPAGSLLFDFTDTEKVRRARSARVIASREFERRKTEAELRLTAAVDAAYRNGRMQGDGEGFQRGFRSGTSWGIFCGAFGTCVLVAIAVIGLALHVGRMVPLF